MKCFDFTWFKPSKHIFQFRIILDKKNLNLPNTFNSCQLIAMNF